MKNQKIKTFKCQKCKNIYQIFRFDQFGKKLVDTRKYWHCKIICDKCYKKKFYNRKSNVSGEKE